MSGRMTYAACAVVLCVFAISAPSQAQPERTPSPPVYEPMQVKKVTDGLYVITGGGGNSTLRVGKDAAILVDTKNPGEPYLSDLEAKIKSITPLPVKYVFITHHHGDHSGNEGVFLRGAVIASQDLADIFRDYKTTKGHKPPPPNVIYAGRSIQVSVDGATAIGYHFGPGHTGGDTVVYFPDIKVVASGDLLADKTPNVDYVPGGGSILGWQRSLDAILALDFDYLITGHGEQIKTRADVIAYKYKWDIFIARARASIKAGTPKDKLMASIKTDDIGWTVTNLGWVWPEMLDAFYAEMSKAP